jgi:uncharacterized membrane protein YqjE
VVGLNSFASWCYFHGLFSGKVEIGKKLKLSYQLLTWSSLAMSGVQCVGAIALTILVIMVIRYLYRHSIAYKIHVLLLMVAITLLISSGAWLYYSIRNLTLTKDEVVEVMTTHEGQT